MALLNILQQEIKRMDPDSLIERIYLSVLDNQKHFPASSNQYQMQSYFITVLVTAIKELNGATLLEASPVKLVHFVKAFVSNNFLKLENWFQLVRCNKKDPHFSDWKKFKEIYCGYWIDLTNFITVKLNNERRSAMELAQQIAELVSNITVQINPEQINHYIVTEISSANTENS